VGRLGVLSGVVLGAVLTNSSSPRAAQGCPLKDLSPLPGQTVSYDGASLAFDGSFLDYTENATFTSPPNSGKPVTAAYNTVYTLDPKTCNSGGTPYHIPASTTGGTEVATSVRSWPGLARACRSGSWVAWMQRCSPSTR
jgi:hypothetical protein